MHLSTLAFATGLFIASGTVVYGSAVLTSDPSSFTNDVDLTSQVSPFTDANGNTATIVNAPGDTFAVGDGQSVTFTVTFAQPVVEAGFDMSIPDGTSQGPFQLSNGDSTGSSSCAAAPPFLCFVGVTDTTPFTSFSIVISVPAEPLPSLTEILDFRYTPASSAPEPVNGTLVAPLLIAGFAAWRLKRRAK